MSKLVVQRIKDRQVWVEGARQASRDEADQKRSQSFSSWLKDKSNSHFGSSTPTMTNGYGVTL